MNKIECYFDGGCDKNPGGIGNSSFVIDNKKEMINLGASKDMSNNVAEWTALKLLAQKLTDLDIKDSSISIIGDSQLVIYGITGKWKVKKPNLIKIATECDYLLYDLKHKQNNKISILWKKRVYNKADLEYASFNPSWN